MGVLVVFVSPPEYDGEVAVDFGQFSFDVELSLDNFEASFEVFFPAAVHEVRVLEEFFQVRAELCLYERQVETAAIIGVDFVDVFEGLEQSAFGDVLSDDLGDVDGSSLFKSDADYGELREISAEPRGFDVEICS